MCKKKMSLAFAFAVMLAVCSVSMAAPEITHTATITADQSIQWWEPSKLADNGLGWTQACVGNSNYSSHGSQFSWGNRVYFQWDNAQVIDTLNFFCKDPSTVYQNATALKVFAMDDNGDYSRVIYNGDGPTNSTTAFGVDAFVQELNRRVVTKGISVLFGYPSSWANLGEVEFFGAESAEGYRNLAPMATLTGSGTLANLIDENVSTWWSPSSWQGAVEMEWASPVEIDSIALTKAANPYGSPSRYRIRAWNAAASEWEEIENIYEEPAYSGQANGDDYVLLNLDSSITTSKIEVFAQMSYDTWVSMQEIEVFGKVVPEPATLLLMLGACAITCRRRRN